MGFTYAHGLILVVAAASLLGVSMGMASKDWSSKSNYTGWGWSSNNHSMNEIEGPNKIIVGGSEIWHFGFNYSNWAFQNAPFYFNDTLVFKYEPPSNTTIPHSVYLFSDLSKKAKMIANVTQGGGDGFEFVLNRWRRYYFACGERNGFHCKVGGMRFMVVPLFRWHY
ncbi:hypothetical protein REPUB_Repub04eG0068600 [Reevesia pubescens]